MTRIAFSKGLSHLVASCLVLGPPAAVMEAAETTGELYGVVVDQAGVGIAGAELSLSSSVLIGGVHRQRTGEGGSFGFRLLPPGTYTLLAGAPGFVSVETEAVVRLNRRTDVEVAMVRSRFEGEVTVEVPAAPAQMDVTRVHIGEVFDAGFLEHASIGIDGRSVVGVINKEAGVEGGARPRVMGSTYSENVFLVDGFNTTDPSLGTVSLEINFDALQEIEVHTGGFEAEYGQALGGVINAVTKSGGNSISGTVDVRYRDQDLAESGEHFDPDREPTSQLVGSATIGGPIRRDRLWYFASLLGSRDRTTGYLSPLTEERQLRDGFGKITWQAAPGHRIAAKGVVSEEVIDNQGAHQFLAADAGQRYESEVTLLQVNLSSVFSDSLLFDVQLGATSSRSGIGPMHGDPDVPQVLNWTTGITSASSGVVARSDVGSQQLRTSLTGLLGGAVGDHELKGGLELRRMKADTGWHQTGSMYLTVMTYDPTGTRPGYGFFDEDGDGFTDALALVMDPEAGAPVHADGTAWSLYLQDGWRPIPRLTVKPGLRWDSVGYVNDGRRDIASLESLQPRLGLAWDVTGQGRHVVRVNVGRSMHPAALSIGQIVNGRRFGMGEYYGYELWCNAGYCDHDFLESLFGPPIVRIDDEGDRHLYYLDDEFWSRPFESIESLGIGTLNTPTADQLMVGTEHRLWTNGTLELMYFHKKTRGLVEDTCRMNGWVWGDGEPPVLDDPSTHLDVSECDGYVLANAPGLKRDYEAVVAKLESRGRRLQLFANYTWSVSEGTTEATADSAFSTLEYDLFPRDFMNTAGYLSDDRRHRAKVYGYLLLPWNTNLGFDARWASGKALDRTIDCGRIIGAPADRLAELGITWEYWYQVCAGARNGDLFFEPRGSRRGGSNYQLDVQIAKGFRIGETQLQVFVTVINLLSSEKPTEVETGELEVLPWGTPLEYQRPRRWEFGLRLDF